MCSSYLSQFRLLVAFRPLNYFLWWIIDFWMALIVQPTHMALEDQIFEKILVIKYSCSLIGYYIYLFWLMDWRFQFLYSHGLINGASEPLKNIQLLIFLCSDRFGFISMYVNPSTDDWQTSELLTKIRREDSTSM